MHGIKLAKGRGSYFGQPGKRVETDFNGNLCLGLNLLSGEILYLGQMRKRVNGFNGKVCHGTKLAMGRYSYLGQSGKRVENGFNREIS